MRLAVIILLFALPSMAHAQLIIQNGKPTTERTEGGPMATQAPGPSKSVMEQEGGYPADAVTAIDKDGQANAGITPPSKDDSERFTPEDSALWPKDAVAIFVPRCARMHRELNAPCACVIREVMRFMPHNEFLALSSKGDLVADKRYLEAQRYCIGTPSKR